MIDRNLGKGVCSKLLLHLAPSLRKRAFSRDGNARGADNSCGCQSGARATTARAYLIRFRRELRFWGAFGPLGASGA